MKLQEVDISLLHPWEKNPRINDHAIDTVAKSIDMFGFNVPILCTKDFTIIAGHTRWKAAMKLGMKKVPVIVLEISETRRKAFSIADNKLSSMATWNNQLLSVVLEELKFEEFDISTLGYTNAEIEALLTSHRDFNWEAFDEYLGQCTEVLFSYIQVKITSATKDSLRIAIRNFAKENKLEDKDPAIMTGKVLCFLLGVKQ